MNKIRSLLALLTIAAFLAPGAPAAASSSGGDVTVAQTLGTRELTVVLRRVTSVPGPLRVETITHAGTPGGSLTLTLAPALDGTHVNHATLTLGSDPGSYGTTMRVDRPGPWELAVSDGARTARIPFVVTGQAVSPAEKAVYGGFLSAGALLLITLVVAVRVRRIGWTLLPGAGLVAALAVATTGAVLSASLPLPPEPGLQTDATTSNAADPYALPHPLTADYSRPPVLLSLAPLSAPGSPPAPGSRAAGRASVLRPGAAVELALRLSDASTGLPVDDLVVHDDALIHLLVVGPVGELWHLHPVRVGAGEYQVYFGPAGAGHYAVSAELERRGGGVQLVRAAGGLDVEGLGSRGGAAYRELSVPAARRVTTTVAGVPVSVMASGNAVGVAVTFSAQFGNSATLQPWLGMLGHLIVVGPVPAGQSVGAAAQRAPVWAHAHSMGDLTPGRNMPGMSAADGQPMAGLMPVNGDSAADETVAGYGPSLSFTFTFGGPGRYLLWMQAERDYRVLTVPAVFEVTG